MPVREIPIQTRSKSGWFYSVKNGRSVAYESLLEKKRLLLLEFDDEVLSYEEQPIRIGNYVPDVLARRKNDVPLLIEVKYSEDAEKPEFQKKLETLRGYCLDNGMELEVFTENDLEEPYFGNVSFLYRYKKLEPKNADAIKRFVKAEGAVPLSELLTRFDPADVYALMARGDLRTNLRKKLSPDSIVRTNNV